MEMDRVLGQQLQSALQSLEIGKIYFFSKAGNLSKMVKLKGDLYF